MSITLFQIKTEYQQIVDALVESGGELTPEIEQSLKINQDQLQEKAINYGYVIKQADYEVDMIDQEIARLQAMKKSREAMVNKLKSTISDAMTLYGIDKIESSMMKLSFRKSETVEITNESLIPSEYLITQPVKISKALIKDSIKSGNEVPGATISINFNLQIK